MKIKFCKIRYQDGKLGGIFQVMFRHEEQRALDESSSPIFSSTMKELGIKLPEGIIEILDKDKKLREPSHFDEFIVYDLYNQHLPYLNKCYVFIAENEPPLQALAEELNRLPQRCHNLSNGKFAIDQYECSPEIHNASDVSTSCMPTLEDVLY